MVIQVKSFTGGKNITESLISALEEWINIQNIRKLNRHRRKSPLKFKKGFSAEKIRELNRK